MKIGDIEAKPGTRAFTSLKVATLASGMTLKIPVHIVNGMKDGPSLLLISTFQGKEWNSMEVTKRLITSIDPKSLSGTLIAIPIANPLSYQSQISHTPETWGSGNPNRTFPGDLHGSLNEKIAYIITEEVLKKVDNIIDLHSTWSSRIAVSCCEVMDGPDNDLTRKSMEMAKIYGLSPIIRTTFPKGYFHRYAVEELGIAGGWFAECGAYGFGAKILETLIQRNIIGIKNVMAFLGMIEDKITIPESQFISTKKTRVALKALSGGHFVPEIGIDRLGDFVEEGEVLGRTISPYSFEELECFKAPYDGICHLIRGPGPIFSGEWVYSISDLRNIEWIRKSNK